MKRIHSTILNIIFFEYHNTSDCIILLTKSGGLKKICSTYLCMANGDEGNPLRAGVVFLPWFLPFWIFLSVVVNSKRKNRINFSFFSGNNDSVTFDMHVWVSVSFNFHFSLQTCQKDFHFTPSHHSLDGKVWIEKDTVGRIGLLMNTLHSVYCLLKGWRSWR